MIFNPPASLTDVITDGILAQSCVDFAVASSLGPIEGMEFSQLADTNSVQVRFLRTAHPPFDAEGEIVAWINDDQWTWVSSAGEDFGIPELVGTHQVSQNLMIAARTLHHNVPAFIAPFDELGDAVVVVKSLITENGFRHNPAQLVQALAVFPPDLNLFRATHALAAFEGLGYQATDSMISIAGDPPIVVQDGVPVELGGGLSMADVASDAALTSIEHQMLFNALFPNPLAQFDPATGVLALNGGFRAPALVLATIKGDTWRWARSNRPALGTSVETLRQFGINNGLLPLVKPVLSCSEAKELHLIDVAKPIIRKWTHLIVDGLDGMTYVLLIDHPSLRLPPATLATVEATLAAPLPADIDPQRAIAAYGCNRRLQVIGSEIVLKGKRLSLTLPAGQS